MKAHSIRPVLYRLSYFSYTEGEHKYPRLSLDKSQYVYRILAIEKGSLDVSFCGKTERIKSGDALYLLPGEVYRLIPCGESFSLYNLFFDFRDDHPTKESIYGSCIFMKHYDSALCLPRIEFDDAPILNQSGIIKGASCDGALRSLLYRSPDDVLYGFYGTSALFSVIEGILTSEERCKKADSVADDILEYIRKNPEGDLSGDALSRLFSYHKNHINKLIKRETGRSLTGYVRYIKIEHARALLSEELCSTSEVAMRLGYYDYSHFYKAYLIETGERPTDRLKTEAKADNRNIKA